MNIKNIQSTINLLFIPCAFLLSILYWVFIFSQAQYIIADDIPGYLSLAELLKNDGWIAYIQSGPNREPLYPLLLSINMLIAQNLAVSFIKPQIISQILILFTSQILVFLILRKLKIQNLITGLIILYMGISPAIIHSTFILYSEIITFPLVLLTIIIHGQLIQHILYSKLPSPRRIFALSTALALLLLILVFAKAVFEILAPILIFLTFILIAYIARNRADHLQLRNGCIFLLTFIFIFFPPILLYKNLNKKLNNHFALTDRGAWALYGQTARRMQPLDGQRFLSALSFTTGWRNCLIFFTDQQCQDWSFIPSDQLGAQKRSEVSKTTSKPQVDQALLKLSIDEAFKNPFQYFILWEIENIKMFFWETTLLQYVLLPEIIIKTYHTSAVYIFFNHFIALITLTAFIYLIYVLAKRSATLNKTTLSILTSILLLSIPYVGIHSFFYILPRYILLLAPLFLIIIAFMFQNFLTKRSL